MYTIEKTDYGFKLTFGGFIQKQEMVQWLTESERVLATTPRVSGLLIDMSGLKPLPEESQEELKKGQKLYKAKGVARIAVVLATSTLKMQFTRIGKETGVYQNERYLDTSDPDWERKGIDWIKHGLDPDRAAT